MWILKIPLIESLNSGWMLVLFSVLASNQFACLMSYHNLPD